MENFLSYSKKNHYSKYGGLKKKYQDTIQKNDVFMVKFQETGVMENLKNLVPPSDQESLEEIHYLLGRMKSLTKDQINFAQDSEAKEVEMYEEFLRSVGIETSSKDIDAIFDFTNPVMYYFKGYFDRARPKQLAEKNGIEYVIPIEDEADHPSYPSGHYFDSLMISHIFSKITPNKKNEISNFCRRMGESRNDVGLHYLSDNEFSKILAKEVINTGLLDIFYK